MENLGYGVSTVYETQGYNFDTVVFQKEKPDLDSESNTVQGLAGILSRRNTASMPSGWLTVKNMYTSSLLTNSFYTQNPAAPEPEFAVVNGQVIYVTNTNTATVNTNLINLGTPPTTGNRVNGVILEVWRALLDPATDANKPPAVSITDPINSIYMHNSQIGWMVGNNGLIINTRTGGDGWNIQVSNVSNNLHGVDFVNEYVGWTVGDGGYIARTTSSGSNWTSLATNVSENLYAISAYDQLNAWVVGASGIILKTLNGINWTRITTGVLKDLKSVHFVDNQTGWACGNDGTILKTSDGGTSWFVKDSGTTSNLNSIYFYDLNYGFAVGDNGTLLETKNGGECWATRVGSTWSGYSLKSVFMASQNAAWVCGTTGLILKTTNSGATWTQAIPPRNYDLNAIFFTDLSIGWTSGYFSIIMKSVSGGDIWVEQKSDVLARTLRRVFYEGNVDCDSSMYLPDNSIHPAANVETTKRVQQQYRIRVLSSIDPVTYPDAGLGSSSIYSLGPNQTEYDAGNFAYTNMGSSTGDYGLWRAKCNNTVDGYVWAIPMFIVNRRNTLPYNISTNPNGSTVYGTGTVRLDRLLATDIRDGDILDVRRRVVIPSLSEQLNKNFDALSNNGLTTRFERKITGGDQYGSMLLQVDGIGTAGGEILSKTMSDLISGNVKSEVTTGVNTQSVAVATQGNIPASISLPTLAATAAYHQNQVYYSAIYTDTNPLDPYIGQKIPGYFTGIGTNAVTFYVGSGAHYGSEDVQASGLQYTISATYVDFSSKGLNKIPYDPQLVKILTDTSPATTTIYYKGIRDDLDSSIMDLWTTDDAVGYYNYAKVYSGKAATDAGQKYRAGTVEIHYYKLISSTTTSISFRKNIPLTTSPSLKSSGYCTYAISKVLNGSQGFAYKIDSITDQVSGDNSMFNISLNPAYQVTAGTVVEIVVYALYNSGITPLTDVGITGQNIGDSEESIRNGNSVNFTSKIKSIAPFYGSNFLKAVATSGGNPVVFTAPGTPLGIPSMETVTSLNQYYCWYQNASITGAPLISMLVSGWTVSGTSLTVTISPADPNYSLFFNNGGNIYIQVLSQLSSFPLAVNSALIGYKYVPYQTCDNLPSSLTVEVTNTYEGMLISNNGSGSDLSSSPYESPLEHIPIDDVNIVGDNYYYNIESLQFSNFSVDTGYVKMPAYVPGSFGPELVLTTPLVDRAGRYYYSVCSKEILLSTEGLSLPAPRKVYTPVLARVKVSSNQFLKGEYVLMIFSRTFKMDEENTTGWSASSNSAIGIYRLPNKPISRM